MFISHRLYILLTVLALIAISSAVGQIHLSGELSGILVDTTYCVDGDISIENGDTLIIEAGADMVFTGNYSFDIYGLLLAIGESNSIISFTINTAVPWQGLRFHSQADDSCRLEYCYIVEAENDRGGGLYFYDCHATLISCTISDNHANEDGGGIYCASNSNLILQDCGIFSNSAVDDGGGIYSSNSQILLSDCSINMNSSGGQGGGLYCGNNSYIDFTGQAVLNFASGEGGGIACFDSYLKYSSEGSWGLDMNDTGAMGGGFYAASNSHLEISKATIAWNESPFSASAFYCSSSNLNMTNCTIAGNYTGASGAAIKLSNCDSATIMNTLIYYYGSQYAIQFLNSQQAQIYYCDIFNLDGNSFAGPAPAGLGQIAGVNHNGDSCDVNFNIYLNPLLISFPYPPDPNLQSNSPCIDAGNPSSPFDPDGTIADIGAFYYSQTGVIDSKFIINPPSFILSVAPNPFNGRTVITIDLPFATYITLTLSNILGERVQTLAQGYHQAGSFQYLVNAENISNGLYFLQLDTKYDTYTKKLLLLK